MSQFMMCKSTFDLTKYGGKKLCSSISNKIFYRVLKEYYPEERDDSVWIIDRIDGYCEKVLSKDLFISSEIFQLINGIYDLCDWIILWFGDEYNGLDVVYTKNGLIKCIQQCIEKPCCELYIRLSKK